METNLKAGEKALQESEAKIRAVLSAAVDAIITIDEHGIIEEANPATERLFGYTVGELIGRNVKLLMPEPYQSEHDGYIEKYLRTSEKKIIGIGREVVGKRKDGTTFPMALAVGEVQLANRKLFTGIVRDITARKQAEDALAAEGERLAVTLRSIGDGVITTDLEGRVVLINKAAEKLTGWAQREAAGRPIGEVLKIINEEGVEPVPDLVERVLRNDEPLELTPDSTLIARDNSRLFVTDSCAPIHDRESKIIGTVLVFRDVTEHKHIEEEIQRSQKFESIGELAGGIAHDFNNHLNVILSNINLAKMEIQPDHKAVESLTEAEKACTWASDLTQRLISFSKGGAPDKKTISLSELLQETSKFALSGSKAKFKLTMPDDLWAVEADEGQIKQVINNLLINADQAMINGGTIQVRAENIPASADARVPFLEGDIVKIVVKDRGTGIPKEVLQKIFNPFFTTKEGGSGLGLASAYSVIKKHDGYINAESEVDVGTEFSIYLPATLKKPIVKAEISGKVMRGQGRILIMDDNDSLRIVAGKLLRKLGYEVELARNGTEAIEFYKIALANENPFDAALLDLTIAGGMGGKETVQFLLKIDPVLKAIACSGYSKDPIIANFKDFGFSGAIVKPFSSKELSDVLKSIVKKNENQT